MNTKYIEFKKKRRSKKWILPIFIILLLGIGIFALFYFDIAQAVIPTGEYIQSPIMAYFECSPATSPIVGLYSFVLTSGDWYTCPENTDECDINLKINVDLGFLAYRELQYEKCDIGGICYGLITERGMQDNHVVTLHNIRKDQKVWVQYKKTFNVNVGDGAIQYSYKPFVLWKDSILSGRNEYTSEEQGCKYPTSDRGDLIESSTIPIVIPFDSVSTTKLEPYKTRNFVESFIPLSKENVQFVTYNNKDGYCINNKIYNIDTIETLSTTYRVVDTNFNTLIANVDCCPADVEPNYKCENFKWIKIEETECSLFNPCEGVEPQTYSSKKLVFYECINSQCVADYINVECTDDFACDVGWHCDTKLWECVTGVTPSITDLEKECLEKAESQKLMGWEWRTKTRCGVNPLCWVGIMQPKIEEFCKPTFLIYWVVGGSILILGTLIILVSKKPKQKRRKKRK